MQCVISIISFNPHKNTVTKVVALLLSSLSDFDLHSEVKHNCKRIFLEHMEHTPTPGALHMLNPVSGRPDSSYQ